MEFLRERVFTSLNADELKAGDKVIVADQLSVLKQRVQEGKKESAIVLQRINGEDWGRRFGFTMFDYALAYLVERVENCTNCEYSNLHNNRLYCDDDKIPIIIGGEKLSVCSKYKPKTEKKAEKKECCLNCKHYNKANDFRDCRLVNNPTGACPHYEAEKHYRPFKDTDELVKVWNKKFYLDFKPSNDPLTMPLIWVRCKASGNSYLITGYFTNDNEVCFSATGFSMDDLLKDYEFLDGSVCGVEE